MGDLQPTFEGPHSDFGIIFTSTKRIKYLIKNNFLGCTVDDGTIILTFELCVSCRIFIDHKQSCWRGCLVNEYQIMDVPVEGIFVLTELPRQQNLIHKLMNQLCYFIMSEKNSKETGRGKGEMMREGESQYVVTDMAELLFIKQSIKMFHFAG